MVCVVKIVKYVCKYCRKGYSARLAAEVCEAFCGYGKTHETEEDWRKSEPKCSIPTDRWTRWSNYGLKMGW